MEIKKIKTPLTNDTIEKLHAGDKVFVSGIIYTARDAAHAKLKELIDNNHELPIELQGQIIYYAGPTPAKPGNVTGSIGPTTSGRMDTYTPKLIELGLKGMIGKGQRSEEVKKAIKEYKSVYMAALGGAGALIAQCIKKVEVVAYPELGTEAIHKIEVVDFPLIVINDIFGNDAYENVGNN